MSDTMTNQMWEGWTGRGIAGKFSLQSYLGSSGHSAVFLSVRQGSDGPEKVAIKLMAVGGRAAEQQLQRWQTSCDLSHPNLIRIFEAGRCEVDGVDLVYVVEEYAEENLSQILPERALTPQEAEETLAPVLLALQFLQEKGLVHGRVRPANIFAIEDQVKLSSDSASAPGHRDRNPVASAYDPPETLTGEVSAPADVWQLGVLLTEVLTQRLPVLDAQNQRAVAPAELPQSFREIIENCLQVDPSSRWSVTQIASHLEGRKALEGGKTQGPTPVAAVAGKPGGAMRQALPHPERSSEVHNRGWKWLYAIVLVAAIAIVLFLIARSHPTAPSSIQTTSIQATQEQQSANPGALAAASGTSEGQVVERVTPKLAPGALQSINGKIRIQVKLEVDEGGKVAKAQLKSAGPSKYFAEHALEAARRWTFRPALENGHPVRSQWIVQFTLSRRGIDDSLTRIEP
ncbi:MAG: TonB family protein [Terriglobales bacterium]|jgi:TonB family protein